MSANQGPPNREPMHKRTRGIVIVVVLLALLLSMVLLFWLIDSGDDFAAIDHGESYGNSIYKRYQGEVYAAVPSNGYYRMGGADPASFQTFDKGRFDSRQAARDASHVYCGNRVLPQMRADTTRYLGNSYFSDGALTYFCDSSSGLNRELGRLDEIWQNILYRAGRGDKPQTYLYPFLVLPASGQPYRPLLDRQLATDGARVFYKGRDMPQADPAQLRRIAAIQGGEARPGDDFFADGHRVYYRETLLPLSDDPALYTFTVGNLYNQPYLHDPRNGMVYLGALAFDPAHAPYRLVNEQGRHVLHALFASRDGIYFYNSEKGVVERAGDDPFAAGGFTALSPYVFRDGRQVLFLKGKEVWNRSRGGGGLVSRSTLILRFKDAPAGDWTKLGDVYHGFGSVWRNGDTLYYLDELGASQLIFSPIYQILDPAAADFLLRSQATRQITADDIRKLVRSGKLAVPEFEEVLEAKTRYRSGVLSIFD
ncbi:DKNYY domain-containing protein [Achromobacter insuavis]|uniref:DKNYY domain-containing protein n=1 Tax=Achromobacter insuavis TaxID=1287735 RepID=UPI0029DC8A71|nr:DKNYY domain-containing protein [Achromobacter sp.]MCG2604547.1 DKNYY domain-containing protein [Achromobacter sp.]